MSPAPSPVSPPFSPMDSMQSSHSFSYNSNLSRVSSVDGLVSSLVNLNHPTPQIYGTLPYYIQLGFDRVNINSRAPSPSQSLSSSIQSGQSFDSDSATALGFPTTSIHPDEPSSSLLGQIPPPPSRMRSFVISPGTHLSTNAASPSSQLFGAAPSQCPEMVVRWKAGSIWDTYPYHQHKLQNIGFTDGHKKYHHNGCLIAET